MDLIIVCSEAMRVAGSRGVFNRFIFVQNITLFSF